MDYCQPGGSLRVSVLRGSFVWPLVQTSIRSVKVQAELKWRKELSFPLRSVRLCPDLRISWTLLSESILTYEMAKSAPNIERYHILRQYQILLERLEKFGNKQLERAKEMERWKEKKVRLVRKSPGIITHCDYLGSQTVSPIKENTSQTQIAPKKIDSMCLIRISKLLIIKC